MYKFNKFFGKKPAIFLIVLSFIISAFYIPVFTPTPKVEAQWAVIDVEQLVQWLQDHIGMILAQELIDQIIDETIDWANSGFEGNPAYVTDPKQFFTDIADGVAGEFIDKELGLDGLLCSPFQVQIRLSLANYYTPERRYQCTLSESIDNIEGFYGDFNQGGWDAWLSMTQNSGNNPYDAYLAAQIDLDRRLAQRLGLEKDQLDRDVGFKAFADCIRRAEGTGECLEYGPIKTPGTTIKAQLDQVLPVEMQKLVSAERLDQVIGAVSVGLLRKFIFSDDGLFSNSYESKLGSSSGLQGAPLTIEDVEGADRCAMLAAIGMPCDYNLVFPTASSTTFGGTGTIGPDKNGCYGTGCEPCSGTDCGVGETIYGDPAINGVYAGSCLVDIVASFFTSVLMTESQCALVNQIISDGITFLPSGAAVGGTYSNAIRAVALVCGGDGGGINEDDSASHYICGFP